MDIEELYGKAEAHYENALDDIRYGYGYNYWREHYDCDKDLSETEAKEVWQTAMFVMTDEYFDGISEMYPTFKTAHMWKEDGCPLLDPDEAVEVYNEAEQIATNFHAEAVRLNENDPTEVLIKDKSSEMHFWVNSWVDERYNDISFDWNQDTFDLRDRNDVLRKLLQDDNRVYDLVSSEALSFQEQQGIVHQWENGDWHNDPEPGQQVKR